MVRHWFIDRCNKQECYICYNNLCYEDILFKKFEINHVNIQPEFGKCDDKDVIVQD